MKKIPLTQGKFALIDNEDFEQIAKHKWCFLNARDCDGYAVRAIYDPATRKSPMVYMHRVIVGTPPGMVTDHANRRTLDNRRSNLRIASHSQNNANRRAEKNNKAGLKGVTTLRDGRFQAQICFNGKNRSIGYYSTARAAWRAYRAEARIVFGEFARA